jgi:regulator of PEP synthase PpsR (kinase-PPPase family)
MSQAINSSNNKNNNNNHVLTATWYRAKINGIDYHVPLFLET